MSKFPEKIFLIFSIQIYRKKIFIKYNRSRFFGLIYLNCENTIIVMYKFKLFFPQSGNQTRRKKQILTIINYNVLNEQTSLMTMYNNNSNTYSSINNTVKNSNIYDSQSTTAKVTAITLGNVQRLGLSWQSGCFQYQRQEVRFQSSAKCYNEHIC